MSPYTTRMPYTSRVGANCDPITSLRSFSPKVNENSVQTPDFWPPSNLDQRQLSSRTFRPDRASIRHAHHLGQGGQPQQYPRRQDQARDPPLPQTSHRQTALPENQHHHALTSHIEGSAAAVDRLVNSRADGLRPVGLCDETLADFAQPFDRADQFIDREKVFLG